jgi:hypothetical protein
LWVLNIHIQVPWFLHFSKTSYKVDCLERLYNELLFSKSVFGCCDKRRVKVAMVIVVVVMVVVVMVVVFIYFSF